MDTVAPSAYFLAREPSPPGPVVLCQSPPDPGFPGPGLAGFLRLKTRPLYLLNAGVAPWQGPSTAFVTGNHPGYFPPENTRGDFRSNSIEQRVNLSENTPAIFRALSAAGLAAMMFLGVLVHVRIRDPGQAAIPALALLGLNLFITVAAA